MSLICSVICLKFAAYETVHTYCHLFKYSNYGRCGTEKGEQWEFINSLLKMMLSHNVKEITVPEAANRKNAMFLMQERKRNMMLAI